MVQPIPETLPEHDSTRVIERPHGFFWQSKEDGREYGPFDTLVEAVLDMQSEDDQTPAPGESLKEAESELGIADWIDPETGQPAEEERPRLEDH